MRTSATSIAIFTATTCRRTNGRCFFVPTISLLLLLLRPAATAVLLLLSHLFCLPQLSAAKGSIFNLSSSFSRPPLSLRRLRPLPPHRLRLTSPTPCYYPCQSARRRLSFNEEALCLCSNKKIKTEHSTTHRSLLICSPSIRQLKSATLFVASAPPPTPPPPPPSFNAFSGGAMVASRSDAPHHDASALSLAAIDREQLRDYVVRLSFDVEFRESLQALDRIVAEDEAGFRKIFGR